jgi:hypothetical protein
MSTNNVDAPASARQTVAPPPAAPPASPLRLIVLLSVLAVSIGALAYDYLVARPGCEAAHKKIQDFVDARNKVGVKEGALVTADDLHKELGMQPTKSESHPKEKYTIEYYCWWGHVPLLNMRRHYIGVVYIGDEPRRFSSHYRNEQVPIEALPSSGESDGQNSQALPTGEGTDATPADAAEAPAAESAPGSDAPPRDKADSKKADSKKADSKKADSNKTESATPDSERADSEKASTGNDSPEKTEPATPSKESDKAGSPSES